MFFEEGKESANSSSETSSTEDTFYLLESPENKIISAYNQPVMKSLAQQMSQRKGLDPAPWLQNVCFTDGLKNRFHMHRTKYKCQLKKDREELEKLTQPELLMNQFEELLLSSEHSPGIMLDQENGYLVCGDEALDLTLSSFARDICCKIFPLYDHGISDALNRLRKYSEKREKRKEITADRFTSKRCRSSRRDM